MGRFIVFVILALTWIWENSVLILMNAVFTMEDVLMGVEMSLVIMSVSVQNI